MNAAALKNTASRYLLLAAAAAGAALGAAIAATIFMRQPSDVADAALGDGREIDYWVAPMDPNYRRDEPGESLMGMALLPVYKDGASADGPGAISISPDVVNNLGVRTAIAQRRKLRTTITTVGYVQYDQDRLVHIHPRVEGWVEELHITAAGNPVTKGQPLYALYAPELVNAQEELLLAVNRKNTRLIQAAKDRLRALQLGDDFIETLTRNARVQQTVTFHAPQTGVVDNLNIRKGFFVMPGTTMMSIGALDEVWVEAEIFERQASFVEAGLPVTMRLDYLPGKQWEGKVDYVYPALDPNTRTVRLRLRFANQDNALKPNMFAQVEIHAHSERETLMIPREAVIRTGNQDRVVLALGSGRFKSIAIQLGRVNSQWAEVNGGLAAGDAIVTSAQFLLDSESSRNSDFIRMHHIEDEKIADSAWVEVHLIAVMRAAGALQFRHRAIAAWNWPAAILQLPVAAAVDLGALRADMIIHVQVAKSAGADYWVAQVRLPTGAGAGRPADADRSPVQDPRAAPGAAR